MYCSRRPCLFWLAFCLRAEVTKANAGSGQLSPDSLLLEPSVPGWALSWFIYLSNTLISSCRNSTGRLYTFDQFSLGLFIIPWTWWWYFIQFSLTHSTDQTHNSVAFGTLIYTSRRSGPQALVLNLCPAQCDIPRSMIHLQILAFKKPKYRSWKEFYQHVYLIQYPTHAP